MISGGKVSKDYFWLNRPEFEVKENRLHITTSADTDFWQRTHYGFRRDNGHCLLRKIQEDFSITVRTEFHPQAQYDQCGLMVRIDSENWIKASMEYETETHSRLGSVVTNLGYSDWATLDIRSKMDSMWYRIQSREHDFLVEYSHDGASWNQLRITHLLSDFEELSIGIYACSPGKGGFVSIFDKLLVEESRW